jgi:hypothetical protein
MLSALRGAVSPASREAVLISQTFADLVLLGA